MLFFIFIVGLLVSTAVCYALFAYTIHEMGTDGENNARENQKAASLNRLENKIGEKI